MIIVYHKILFKSDKCQGNLPMDKHPEIHLYFYCMRTLWYLLVFPLTGEAKYSCCVLMWIYCFQSLSNTSLLLDMKNVTSVWHLCLHLNSSYLLRATPDWFCCSAMKSKPAHILGSHSTRQGPLPERELSSLSCAILRLLTHLAMFTSSLFNKRQVSHWYIT